MIDDAPEPRNRTERRADERTQVVHRRMYRKPRRAAGRHRLVSAQWRPTQVPWLRRRAIRRRRNRAARASRKAHR